MSLTTPGPSAWDPPRRPTRGRPGLWVTGTVLVAVALLTGAVAVAQIVVAAGGSVVSALRAEVAEAPVTLELVLQPGRYDVFEFVGREETSGSLTTASGSPATVTAEAVEVTGPAGRVPVTSVTPGRATVTREGDVYTAVVTFTVVEAGDHTVRVDPSEPARVFVAEALGSGTRDTLPWLVAALATAPLLVVGVVLVVLGLAWRRPVP